MPEKREDRPRGRGRPPGSTAEKRILAGAIEAFAGHGFHDCTVEKILAAAGVARPTFYRFFKSKEQVFDAVVQRGIRNIDRILVAAIEEAEGLETDEEKVAWVLRRYLKACFDSGPMVGVMNQPDYNLPNTHSSRLAGWCQDWCWDYWACWSVCSHPPGTGRAMSA